MEIGNNIYLKAIRHSFVQGGKEYLELIKQSSLVSLFNIQYRLLTNSIGAEALAGISDEIISSILPNLVRTLKQTSNIHKHKTIRQGTEEQRIRDNLFAFRATAKYQIANKLDNSNPEEMLFSQGEV